MNVKLCGPYRTDEGGRQKCGQYWPLEEGGQEVYGHMAVVNQRVDHHPHYNHISLELHNTEVPTSLVPYGRLHLGGQRPVKGLQRSNRKECCH